MTKQTNVQVGNAEADATNGWFIGSFIPESLAMRHSEDLEIKWGVHKKGEKRDWAAGGPKTLTILISGMMKQGFKDQEVSLQKPGDYVLYYGVEHQWEALEDSIIMTVRWPSIRQY